MPTDKTRPMDSGDRKDLSGRNVLFEDDRSDSAMNDGDVPSLFSDTFLDRPIAITYEAAPGTTNGED